MMSYSDPPVQRVQWLSFFIQGLLVIGEPCIQFILCAKFFFPAMLLRRQTPGISMNCLYALAPGRRNHARAICGVMIILLSMHSVKINTYLPIMDEYIWRSAYKEVRWPPKLWNHDLRDVGVLNCRVGHHVSDLGWVDHDF